MNNDIREIRRCAQRILQLTDRKGNEEFEVGDEFDYRRSDWSGLGREPSVVCRVILEINDDLLLIPIKNDPSEMRRQVSKKTLRDELKRRNSRWTRRA